MKIEFDDNTFSTDRMKVRASAKKVLVFRATNCEVDMSLGRIIVTCDSFSVHEKKET